MSLFSEITINDTNCGCDGGMTIFADGGTSPYSFSIDNGLTFKKFPIYNNLCQGNYVVVVTDVSGETFTNFATLNPPSNPITYTLYLTTTSELINISPTLTTIQYLTKTNIFPELQDGVTISFDLSHSNLLKSSPNSLSASATSVSQLTIDAMIITASTSGITTGSTFNPIPGCQDQTLYLNTFNENWTNLSINNTSDFSLITTNSLYKNDFVSCYIGDITPTFSISNLSISGCNCCVVVSG